MTDIVERLRDTDVRNWPSIYELANKIEHLRAERNRGMTLVAQLALEAGQKEVEIKRLQAALMEIAYTVWSASDATAEQKMQKMREIARVALEQKP